MSLSNLFKFYSTVDIAQNTYQQLNEQDSNIVIFSFPCTLHTYVHNNTLPTYWQYKTYILSLTKPSMHNTSASQMNFTFEMNSLSRFAEFCFNFNTRVPLSEWILQKDLFAIVHLTRNELFMQEMCWKHRNYKHYVSQLIKFKFPSEIISIIELEMQICVSSVLSR